MKRTLTALFAASAMFAGLASTPAMATTGREAVNLCMAQGAAECAFASQADGSIRITTRDGQSLRCTSADGACAMVYRAPRTLVEAPAPNVRAVQTARVTR